MLPAPAFGQRFDEKQAAAAFGIWVWLLGRGQGRAEVPDLDDHSPVVRLQAQVHDGEADARVDVLSADRPCTPGARTALVTRLRRARCPQLYRPVPT